MSEFQRLDFNGMFGNDAKPSDFLDSYFFVAERRDEVKWIGPIYRIRWYHRMWRWCVKELAKP